MCTAVSFLSGDHYFGRTLDLDRGYREQVTVTPRNFPLRFRRVPDQTRHYALIGMATVVAGTPLYYEATNERGLSMAGLNFPFLAKYFPAKEGCTNVASFELIPWLLGQCATVREARLLLQDLRITEEAFAPGLPPSPLHWMLSDRECSVVIEQTEHGLQLYENPTGVMTNAPEFSYHLRRLSDMMQVTAQRPVQRFAPGFEIDPVYCEGLGAMGLPGDLSSNSRFLRAAFTKMNSVCQPTEEASVSQFFHILDSVAMTRGTVLTASGHWDTTRYSCCCNTDKGIYYYTTYENRAITAVDLHRTDPEGSTVLTWDLREQPRIQMEN